MKKIFTHNLGLKAVSLVLAILTWFYIYAELTSSQRGAGLIPLKEDEVQEFEVDNLHIIK